MRVRDLQQILGKFTDGEKGTNVSDCPIYLETKDGYLEEVRFIALEKNKINPIVCEFRDKQFWDNGIHCITQDLYREGSMEDYFSS